jgi:predicted nucleic acid-binding protein
LTAKNYEIFLNDFDIQIIPLLKSDVEKAASLRPSKRDVLDALIASCSLRLSAKLVTFNKDDFKKFLKREQILVPEF